MGGKEFEEDDPMELVGVVLSAPGGKYAEAMAETFIEEYLRMGWPEEMILGLFKVPFYHGPHLAYKAMGENRVKRMIEEVRSRLRGGI